MKHFAPLALVLLAACPPPEPPPVDSGVEVDSGVIVPCDTPEDCRAAGLSAACRQSECRPDVPCGDDLECGLGERCVRGQCRFTGCTQDSECPTGKCLTSTFTCVECGADKDCPRERPVCNVGANTCVQCASDVDCGRPGPAHCSNTGACVACTEDAHCPNGLKCSSGNTCFGAGSGAPCPEGTSCGPGLACVNVGSNPICLQSCNLYSPMCGTGQICYRLTYANSNSLVFESEGPIGVCFSPQQGARGLREPCARSNGGSNCQPNLQCVNETSQVSLCRAYCNPLMSGTCPAGEKCTAFPGDYSGREFGLCLPDNGFGTRCDGDSQCRTGLSCQPYDDPSASSEVSTFCQFNVGGQAGLSPCAPLPLSDGGVLAADRICSSGLCANDPLFSSASAPGYFCFAACRTDMDCSTGGRTGACDGTFDVTTPFETQGTVKGCRPGCESASDCAAYDAGVTCRIRVNTSVSTPSFVSTCSPPAGSLPAGAPCTSSLQCASAYCFLDDARGVRRAGTCVAPCRAGETCPAGGALSLGCLPTAVLVSRGPDSRAGTADDTVANRSLCSGATCTTSVDCGGDGGVVCAPELDPAQPLTALVRRCRMPTTGARVGGEACAADSECRSGVCGQLQPPSTGTGRACFEACDMATVCPGATTCRAGGMRVTTAAGSANFDSCAP